MVSSSEGKRKNRKIRKESREEEQRRRENGGRIITGGKKVGTHPDSLGSGVFLEGNSEPRKTAIISGHGITPRYD